MQVSGVKRGASCCPPNLRGDLGVGEGPADPLPDTKPSCLGEGWGCQGAASTPNPHGGTQVPGVSCSSSYLLIHNTPPPPINRSRAAKGSPVLRGVGGRYSGYIAQDRAPLLPPSHTSRPCLLLQYTLSEVGGQLLQGMEAQPYHISIYLYVCRYGHVCVCIYVHRRLFICCMSH